MSIRHRAWLAGTTLIVAVLAANAALAADYYAAPVAVQVPIWPQWYVEYAKIEFGGQYFFDKPDNTRSNNLAKFEEYGKRTAPAFLDYLKVGVATTDGLYFGNLFAEHVGQNNQKYELQLAKTGEHYLTLRWDQIPHLYSTTAMTIFNGVGTPYLTVDPGVVAALNVATGVRLQAYSATNPGPFVQNQVIGAAAFVPRGCYLPNGNGGNPADCKGKTDAYTIINNSVHRTDLGIERDKGTAEYRYTPNPGWDVKVAYSHERRFGTQETGFLFSSAGTSAPMAQVPRPISDTTQDATVSAEYAGDSFWGQKWNAMVSYNASVYTDDYAAFIAQNPFGGPPNPGQTCFASGATAAATAATANDCYAFGQMSNPPSNWAGRILATTGVDLPLHSRYMGTFAYTMMKQDAAFIPMTINPGPIPFTASTGATPFASVPGVPRTSLLGDINTTLSNNVLTTQLSPDWKNKASYRYYSQDNNTPPLTLAAWVVNDSRYTGVGGVGGGDYNPHTTMFSSYSKQNFADDVTWRPAKWLNMGVGYGWERYERSLSQVNTTNENTGRAFADLTPVQWLLIRGSYAYSARRYDNYDWQTYVANVILAGTNNFNGFYNNSVSENPLTRTFDMANRDRKLAKVSVDIMPFEGLTITPSGGLRFDDYPVDGTIAQQGQIQLGITKDHSWNAGIEATYVVNRRVTLMASYMWEEFNRNLVSGAVNAGCVTFQFNNRTTPFANSPTGNNNCSFNLYQSAMFKSVNTIMAAINVNVIPDRFSLKFAYTYVYAKDNWDTFPFGTACTTCFLGVNIAGAPSAGAPAFPDYNSIANRFDATAKYLDSAYWGFWGETFVKVRYLYEQNKVNNWQNDQVQVYMYAVTNSSTTGFRQQTYMAGDNPNYRVQAVALVFGGKW